MDKIKEALQEQKEIGFEVTNPQKSFAGHTVYRLQLKVYAASDTNTYFHFIGWKRYNDFKKLHKDLKVVFSDDIKLGFPVFPKGKIFGRFDDSVIEERRQTCITFLQFILSNQEMLFHQHFHNFVNNNELLSGKEINDTNSSMSFTTLMDELVELPENIENDTENTEVFEDIIDNEENGGDITFSIENTVDNRQTWLREARSICECDLDLDIPSSEEASVLLDEPLANDTAPSPSSNDGLEPIDQTSEDQTSEDVDETDESKENTISIDSLAIRTGGPSGEINFIVDDKMSQKIEETVQQDDYVFHASVAMSNAIEQEELRNYDAAFDMYKFGIGLLLRGVQQEMDLEKREAVRRKTAQYLMRAEELYKSSLQTTENMKSYHVLGDSKWRFRLSDVKVFGIIKSVMLVQKILSKDVYVMKVLHKTGADYKGTFQQKRKPKTERNLYNCRFMTKLINCVETQTGVYLLLEYVSGGLLWDYLNLPVFLSGHRHPSMNENHHSWSNTEFSNNATVDINDNHGDIIDIHCKAESKEKLRNRTSSVRLKRSLSQTDGYSEDFIQIWAVQIALALMALHNYGVICRDLNPKNIMIDNKGNIKLTYFSKIDGIDYTLDTDAVTYLYTSPEVEQIFEINKATDWWSYGAIIFELLMGQSLYSCHPTGIDSRSIITLPRRVSNEACSLLASFLQFNTRDRLGSGPHGSEEIKSHSFFDKVDWEQLNI